MSKPEQYGCKKCGAVIAVEVRGTPDKVEVRVRDARVQERSGKFQVSCKKCRSVIAEVGIEVC